MGLSPWLPPTVTSSGIVSDDGSHFVPGKIDPMFQVDGLRVTYRVLERHDRDDPHNWGIPVDLLELVQVGRVIEQRIDGNGTIHYEDLEGGFYGIMADSGERYLPINLNDTFKIDGLRVKFSAYPASIVNEFNVGYSGPACYNRSFRLNRTRPILS